METEYYYQFRIGTKTFSRYGLDDRRAKRLAAKWISLYWESYKQHIHDKYPGSMSDAENNGWYNEPEVVIGRTLCGAGGIVLCRPIAIIERFPLNEESKKEFIRSFISW